MERAIPTTRPTIVDKQLNNMPPPPPYYEKHILSSSWNAAGQLPENSHQHNIPNFRIMNHHWDTRMSY
jgi:hypothetical protein